MAIKVEEYIREDASNPYKQWFDSMGEYVIDWGPGYRIYLVKARALLVEYKARKQAMTAKSGGKHKG